MKLNHTHAAHQDALKREIERLRQVYHQQSLKKMENAAGSPLPLPNSICEVQTEKEVQLLNVWRRFITARWSSYIINYLVNYMTLWFFSLDKEKLQNFGWEMGDRKEVKFCCGCMVYWVEWFKVVVGGEKFY